MMHARPGYREKLFPEVQNLIDSDDTFSFTVNGMTLFHLIQMAQFSLMNRVIPKEVKFVWRGLSDSFITLIEDSNPELARLLRLGYEENKDAPI